MATVTRAGKSSRARTTRRQRIIRALTPKRVRRAQARWTRRARTVKRRYTAFRTVVARDQKTLCGECGRKVPQALVAAHVTRHKTQAAKAAAAVARKRAAAAKRHQRHAGKQQSNAAGSGGGVDARPSRVEAARSSCGWVALGSGALLASPLFLNVGGMWLGVAGAGCVTAGAAAYSYERRWGRGNHGARASRRATREAGRQSGCNAACMNSTKPISTCECPCRHTAHPTHGILARRAA